MFDLGYFFDIAGEKVISDRLIDFNHLS